MAECSPLKHSAQAVGNCISGKGNNSSVMNDCFAAALAVNTTLYRLQKCGRGPTRENRPAGPWAIASQEIRKTGVCGGHQKNPLLPAAPSALFNDIHMSASEGFDLRTDIGRPRRGL